jgi:phosphatidylserine decarboxylase
MGVNYLVIFASSLFLTLIIFLPLSRKFEIQIKTSIRGGVGIGILVGLSVALLSPSSPTKLFLYEVLFLILFTGIIGLYRFYRDPHRVPPQSKNIILSPADGFIRYIKQISNTDVSDFGSILEIKKGWRIGITMTYIDVHINRSPVAGKIVLKRYLQGSFLSLKKEEALSKNKRAVVVIDRGDFKIGLSLIASRIVRKIVLWIKEGEKVELGQRIGKIVFGSQTDIIIPSLQGLKIKVTEREQVYAGITIIAEIS